MSKQSKDNKEPSNETDYFYDIPDGSGCTEIWEKLSEKRNK